MTIKTELEKHLMDVQKHNRNGLNSVMNEWILRNLPLDFVSRVSTPSMLFTRLKLKYVLQMNDSESCARLVFQY